MQFLGSDLNPFTYVIGNRFAPHAHTLNSTLWGKLKTAFRTFMGDTDSHGLTDYATLFIFPLLRSLYKTLREVSSNENNRLSTRRAAWVVGNIIILPLAYIALAAKAIVSAALTVATALVTGIVHVFSLLAKSVLWARAGKAELSKVLKDGEDPQPAVTLAAVTAGKTAERTHAPTNPTIIRGNTDSTTTIMLSLHVDETEDRVAEYKTTAVTTEALLSNAQSPQARAVSALVKLDVDGISERLDHQFPEPSSEAEDTFRNRV